MRADGSMRHASEMPVNALDAECLIAVNDASSNLYEIIYGLEAAIDMEDREYCDLPNSMRLSEENEPPEMERYKILRIIELLYDAQLILQELE